MFNFLRYQLFPYIKVRAVVLWWTIRYGGSKNIPSEKFAERMEENIENLRNDLHNALRALPDDATEEERQMVLDAISEANEVERLYREGFEEED